MCVCEEEEERKEGRKKRRKKKVQTAGRSPIRRLAWAADPAILLVVVGSKAPAGPKWRKFANLHSHSKRPATHPLSLSPFLGPSSAAARPGRRAGSFRRTVFRLSSSLSSLPLSRPSRIHAASGSPTRSPFPSSSSSLFYLFLLFSPPFV